MGFVSDPQVVDESGWQIVPAPGPFQIVTPVWIEIVGEPHAEFLIDRETHTGRYVRAVSGRLDQDGVHLGEIVAPGTYRVICAGSVAVRA